MLFPPLAFPHLFLGSFRKRDIPPPKVRFTIEPEAETDPIVCSVAWKNFYSKVCIVPRRSRYILNFDCIALHSMYSTVEYSTSTVYILHTSFAFAFARPIKYVE